MSDPGLRIYAIKKKTTDTNKITLDPPGSVVIEGGTGGTNLDLPGSTGTTRPSWTIAYDGNDDVWWVL